VDEVTGGEEAPAWTGHTGLISAELLSETFEKLPSRPDLVCVCGPPGMHKSVRSLLTEKLDYEEDSIFEF